MPNLRKKLSAVAVLLAAACAGTVLVVACSDDGGGGTSDGGTDGGGTDATTDTNNPPTEGGTDGGTDGPVIVEAGTLADFLKLNPEASCARYKECCGAAFDTAKCVTDLKTAGWVQSLTDLTPPGVATGGKVVYDAVAGSECLTSIRNMTCKNTPAAEYKASLTKCFAAAKGNGAAGTTCLSNAECSPTTFCDTEDGGTTCANLKATGAQCTPLFEGCSYRGAGASQCLDPDGDGTSNCGPQLADGTSCSQDFDCQSGACNVVDDGGTITATCAATVDFLFGVCELYSTADGGDGG